MGPKRKSAVAGVSDAQSVEVRDWGGQTYFACGIGGMPQRQKKLLRLDQPGVSSCLDLTLGVIDLEDLDVVRRKAFAE